MIKMNGKFEVKKRYDMFAEKLDTDMQKIKSLHADVSPVLKYFRRRKIDTALELGKLDKGVKVLEIGSNVGQNTTMLAKRGLCMVGIDISEKVVGVAKKNAEALDLKIDYFPADAENLSLFGDEVFDGVVSFSTLRYVPNLEKALREIFRVTKKGGVVVLDFPNRYCPWFTLLKNKFGIDNHICDHSYSTRALSSLFREVGFKDIEVRKILFTHYTFPTKFLNLYKMIDCIGEHTPIIKEMAAIIFCKGVKV
jgi:ubiquinone/menaquinone biosynthesis C-methylase UbiE